MSTPSPLARLPAELIGLIFGALLSFSDVARFAATCRRHRQVWVDFAYTIYRQVAPRTAPCRKLARLLLAAQGGPPVSATHLSHPEVLQLISNAAVGENSVADLEKHHIRRVKENELVVRNPRPRHLSRSERIRYIRGVYQLWGLALLGPEARQQRINSMTLKDMLEVRDLVLGDAVHIADPVVLAMRDGYPYAAFEMVYVDMYPRLEQIVSDLYDEDISSWGLPYCEGLLGRISFWDSYYDMSKEMILGGLAGKKQCPDPGLAWEDTSDDDRIDE
ncbi:hypothetical protein P170DRAFT_427092 [Aspergillus steynii IBT 23096]|uniref:F-box domain-containing protein n=1 Tax=Aspergillus steynii IBT 23096 TaxID=1392250 RepID=A0A2I2G4W4_9EURO|nr:uncharacterized protein P170DRAFT_427092 [Aspergillus steynii IBT 23096]PLB47920.1 hypothetical protein P170DRAFT_427092 [Aspergillus steynii IBT 23096]